MDKLISSKAKSIDFSPIRAFSNLVSQVPGAISLTIGQPDFNTPENIKSKGIEAINHNYTSYTKNNGSEELRKEIAVYLKRRYSLEYDYNSELIVTIGAAQAIDLGLRTLINEGDEVLIPSPGYTAYGPCTVLSGGKPVFVPVYAQDDFKLRADVLRKYITPKSKILILSYPSNPTGATLDADDLSDISKVIIENDMAVISDEIYSEMTYEKPHKSVASIYGMKDRTLLINGFSKAYSMTGWRLGYIAAPKNISEHLIKVHQYSVTCASSISQAAGVEALSNGDKGIEEMVKEYNKRRLYCYERLCSMGLKCFKPTGAFYIFPEIKNYGLTSQKFCEKLLYEGKLAAVPGSAFGEYGEGYIRISYAYSIELLEEGLNRLERFIGKL